MSYGKEATTSLANKLISENITIISGMAKGIDSYAHTAAIKSGGYTVAVLGNIYDPLSEGSNSLIDRGAKIYLPMPTHPAALCTTTSYHNPIGKEIIKLLGNSSFPIEVIRKEQKFSLEEIQEAPFLLELDSQVECLGGMVKVL